MTIGKNPRLAVLALSFALFGLSSWGMPAKKGLISVTQPDGEVIEVQLIGDEHCHMYLTEDGYPLVAENNSFYYADAREGSLHSTGIRARAISRRTPSETAALRESNRSAVGQTFNHMRSKVQVSQNGMKRSAANLGDPGRFLYRTFPNHGKQKALIFLAEYPDVPFTLDDPLDYFTRMLNEPGFSTRGATGSANDFFMESSNGQFDPQFDVFGPVMLKNPRAYYGGSNEDLTAWQMIIECCDALDSQIDFSEYDRDGDGYIDNIYLFFAGEGESSSGIAETVWPHASRLVDLVPDRRFTYDGLTVNSYGVSNEWENGNPDGVGTFCHEFSHVMGLPDLYPTEYTDAFDPGPWSALAYGPYNNEGRTPPLYSAFERYCVGWIDLEELPSTANITLPPVGTGKAYAVKTNNPDEFYIFENRQQTSWDTYLPHHGMLVWHIDYDRQRWDNNAVNNQPKHQRVDIVEADGSQNEETRAGDAFPGNAGITSFTDDTNPSMMSWLGYRLSHPLTEIAETADGLITFKVSGGYDPLPAPADLATAAQPTSRTISLEWSPVEGAETYEVAIYHAGTFLPVANYTSPITVDTPRAEFTGLTPSTSYCVYVLAINGKAAGAPSRILNVSTAEPSFEDIIPVANEAFAIGSDRFTTSWESVDGADNYLINVYTKVDGEPHNFSVDFTGGLDALPQGWTSTSKLTYSLSGYAGAAVPSLRLSNNGDALQSAEFADGISALSFWHRGNGAKSVNNSIIVYGLFGTEWKELARLSITKDSGGRTDTVDNIPEGCAAIKIEYLAPESASLAIDDIVLSHGATKVRSLLPEYSAKAVGNTGQFTVEGLDPETDYFYTVRAAQEGRTSEESNEVEVRTAKTSGLDSVSPAESLRAIVSGRTVSLYGAEPETICTLTDIAGRTVAAIVISESGYATLEVATPGIYVLRTGSAAIKLAIK